MTSPDTSHTNQLIDQTSPYLQQHAHNPVEWYPWNEEALNKARSENKPILLSIGYSACHWCHVMAHESFEDAATARLMNELFVNIKVDREERPDLDKIYQTAHHLLTQRSGGWPLTMFLTPEDQTPFFGGTYFPPEPRHGMPSFSDLMRRVEGYYREHRKEIDTQNSSLIQALAQTQPATAGGELALDAQPLDSCRYQLEQNYDAQYAGFGTAPKFPHPTSIDTLMRHWVATRQQGKEDTRSLVMARHTLHAMASGGIYDQLGGGFCRYSVDEHWMIPHFEKMLYDNAQLLPLYANAYLATGDKTFRRVTQETADWVIREMQAPAGGYYSTLDADSEGEEGKFYVWTPDEVAGLLTADEFAAFAPHFGLDRSANFEGAWHLHVFRATKDIADKLGQTEDEIDTLLASASAKLLKVREGRIRPGRDEKILTAWNGLMIKGMAAAGRLLGNETYIQSAERALDFAQSTLWQNGRLLATCKDDTAHLNAYLDDYVFLIEGTLELLQARWREGDLAFAIELAEVVLAHFEDKQNGGFYFTADDHEQLIHRPKPVADDAIPAGNGVAVFVLQRLGHLLGETRYLQAAERALKAAWPNISQVPYAHNSLLIALEEYLYPTQTIVLRGKTDAMQPWLQQCTQDYAPRRFSIAIPDDAQDLPAPLNERGAVEGEVTAYVCSGHSCQAPVTDLAQFKTIL